MAVLIITAKPAFLPDPDDLAGWELQGGLYHRQAGAHHLFLAECIEEVNRKQRAKHEHLAELVRAARQAVPDGECYLIAHDRDLLKGSGSGDEGIFPEAGVAAVGSSLAGLVPDRHIYIFQHVPQQDMFETLIVNLLDDITAETVERTVSLIDGCTYETSLA